MTNEGLNANNLCVPKVYAPVFFDEEYCKAHNETYYRYFLLSSGRISGKTSVLVALWWHNVNKYPDRDIVICQSTSTEIKDSIIVEIEKFLRNSGFDVGDSPVCMYYIPKSKDVISIKGTKGKTHIYAITDSTGGQRSRGVNTANPISLVLYEEAQKNRDRNVLEQSVITFIRQLDRQAKIVIVGNNEYVGHWFADYVDEKKNDEDWRYIYACYLDIWQLLNQQTRDYIENFKKANEIEFRRVFLGDINASSSDVVFPQFSRQNNYKKNYELTPHRISYLFIGIDHATADDTFACVPVAVLDNGETQTLQVCYNDPKETQKALAPSEQCLLLERFMRFLNDYYGIVENRLPVVLSVDGQASPFIEQLKHTRNTSKDRALWKGIQIKGFTLKKKDVNLGIIKNAFAYNVLTILNEGGRMWDGRPNMHRLVKEIEAQRYKNGKLNPKIPNDLCDALEYGLMPYYTNCYNISFPVRHREMELAHYRDIRKLANLGE